MTKRRIIVIVLLIIAAIIVGVIVVRALPNGDAPDQTTAPAQTEQSEPNNPRPNAGATDNPATPASDSPAPADQGQNNTTAQQPLVATGPEDSVLVFVAATVLGMGVSQIWRISRRSRA